MYQGQANIVAFLSEMPKTVHLPESFVVDVPFHSDALLIIVVNGVYHEVQNKGNKLVRFFCRTFTIVPQGGGFVIINDQLMAGNATSEQVTKFKAISGGDDPSTSTPTYNPGVSSVLNQNKLIENFARETKMTAAFSRQCLEENNYDFNKALDCFYELNKRGAIPREAFL